MVAWASAPNVRGARTPTPGAKVVRPFASSAGAGQGRSEAKLGEGRGVGNRRGRARCRGGAVRWCGGGSTLATGGLRSCTQPLPEILRPVPRVAVRPGRVEKCRLPAMKERCCSPRRSRSHPGVVRTCPPEARSGRAGSRDSRLPARAASWRTAGRWRNSASPGRHLRRRGNATVLARRPGPGALAVGAVAGAAAVRRRAVPHRRRRRASRRRAGGARRADQAPFSKVATPRYGNDPSKQPGVTISGGACARR